jgi:hypothetical protein
MGMRRTALLLVSTALAVLLVSGVAWAATITFAPAKNYPAGDDPRAVAAADLDRDGDNDIATVNTAIDKVSVLKRRSDGTFGTPVKYTTGDAPSDIVGREDFDGDGDVDLAVSNHGAQYNYTDSISVLLNKGDGTFAAQRKYATAGRNPTSIESGDFDADGDWDIATTDEGHRWEPNLGSSQGTVSVFLSKGDGTFAAARGYAPGAAPFELDSIDRADLDGDGDEDLTISIDYGRGEESGMEVLLSNGDGTFAYGGRYPMPSPWEQTDYVTDILANDLDGDGDWDIATTGRSTATGGESCGALNVFLGNGDGTFQHSYRLDTNTCGSAMTEADFDRDDDLDLATVDGDPYGAPSSVNGKVTVLVNAGDATFGNETTVGPTFGVGNTPMDILRTRMNGDTKPDLVVANDVSDKVSVLVNTTQ